MPPADKASMSVWVWEKSREGMENQWKGDPEEGSGDEGGEVLGRVHFATYSLTGCCYGRMSVATEVPIAKTATGNRRHNTNGPSSLHISHTTTVRFEHHVRPKRP